MKKLLSLIKACMTSDMNLFKIKSKKKNSIILPLFIAGYLMFMIWGMANGAFEKFAPLHLQYLVLSLFAFGISFMTIIEGVYKTGSLIFNCKDDQLLLSLPIKRRTVLFIRIFKFYVFELLFNSMFLLPIMVAYIRWAEVISWTYYLTSIIMLLFLPIIPIVISCILGVISSSITSRFKYKNAVQIIISFILVLGIIFVSYNMDGLFNYIMLHATSISDFITKIYYPVGVYTSLIEKFDILKLLIFILVHISIFIVSIFILSKFYFKINSRLKKVTTTKKTKISTLTIKSNSIYKSLIKKELNTFFSTPVFVINAGFGMILFVIATIIIAIKFDSLLPMLESANMSKDFIMKNLSIFIFLFISATSYMTSITSSVISLEGKNINILKTLPVKTKTILMSKVYSSVLITTPLLILGNIVLFIKFKLSIIESLLLIVLCFLVPLVSHFIGILVNLKYPKLDFENETEVVKQSAGSFISVLIGFGFLMTTFIVLTNLLGIVNPLLLLIISTLLYIIIDIVLYMILCNKGVKEFNSLSV